MHTQHRVCHNYRIYTAILFYYSIAYCTITILYTLSSSKHPSNSQLALKGTQRRARVIGPVTPGGSSQAILKEPASTVVAGSFQQNAHMQSHTTRSHVTNHIQNKAVCLNESMCIFTGCCLNSIFERFLTAHWIRGPTLQLAGFLQRIGAE